MLLKLSHPARATTHVRAIGSHSFHVPTGHESLMKVNESWNGKTAKVTGGVNLKGFLAFEESGNNQTVSSIDVSVLEFKAIFLQLFYFGSSGIRLRTRFTRKAKFS